MQIVIDPRPDRQMEMPHPPEVVDLSPDLPMPPPRSPTKKKTKRKSKGKTRKKLFDNPRSSRAKSTLSRPGSAPGGGPKRAGSAPGGGAKRPGSAPGGGAKRPGSAPGGGAKHPSNEWIPPGTLEHTYGVSLDKV